VGYILSLSTPGSFLRQTLAQLKVLDVKYWCISKRFHLWDLSYDDLPVNIWYTRVFKECILLCLLILSFIICQNTTVIKISFTLPGNYIWIKCIRNDHNIVICNIYIYSHWKQSNSWRNYQCILPDDASMSQNVSQALLPINSFYTGDMNEI
jgi:hypothetical protein